MKHHILITSVCLVFGLLSCSKVLDKKNLNSVNPSDVWASPELADAYLNNIYAALMPGNPAGLGSRTDEAIPHITQTNEWLSGTATMDSWDIFGLYDRIRDINILLENIDEATFDENRKDEIKGQGLFWRAWCYYALVWGYGGVPLVLIPQSPSNFDSLYLPRNTTSECVAQIVRDLDEATTLLPPAWSGSNVGKIDKGVSMAFKGRVLLFFASPLFNPSNDISKWQAAYDANLAAKNFLDSRGNGLYESFGNIWDDELNKEVIMVRRFGYPSAVYSQAALRPIRYASGASGADRPSLELVNAFPMADGSSWDEGTMSYDTLFKHRDARFYATIYYNGSPNQYIADMRESTPARPEGEYLWTYFNSITSYYTAQGITGTHNEVTPEAVVHWSGSSFYRIKGVDKTTTVSNQQNCGTDWPEIRYAEVLMNYGEAANELGKTNEALDVLYKIRERAEIAAGPEGKYGVTADNKEELREAYLKERFVEFAFEDKRWSDLRRWKRFDILNNMGQRHGLAIELKAGETPVNPKDDINDVWTKFKSTVVNTDRQDIDIKDQFYIYGIPKTRLDRNSKLEQNNNWGGSFDPLK